jgi:hypothetical protein
MADGILTEDDKKQLERDIAETKQAIAKTEVEKAVTQAKTETRAEVEKEFKLQQELDKQKAEAEALKKQLADQQVALQKQIDELRTSKAIVEPKNPFAAGSASKPDAMLMSDEQVKAIEASSLEALRNRSLGQ